MLLIPNNFDECPAHFHQHHFGPYLLHDRVYPNRSKHYGLDLDLQHLFQPTSIPKSSIVILSKPGSHLNSVTKTKPSPQTNDSVAKPDEINFQVNLDVQQYSPEELSVRVSGENIVTVEGKHEERQDEHGFISRRFERRFVIPKDYDMEKIESRLSCDGVLTLTAPRMNVLEGGNKNMPVSRTE